MYFKFDLDWLMDLDLFEAIIYGLILNSDTKNIRFDENGEVYKRMPNNYLTYWIENLPNRSIKKALDNLVECNYIKVLNVRKPMNQVRYISTTYNDRADTIYILREWLNKYSFGVCVALGCLFRDYAHYNLIDEDCLDDLAEMIPDVYKELRAENLVDDEGKVNDDLYDEFEKNKKLIIRKV